MAWEPERWRGKGLPPEVEKLMAVGAQIEVEAEVGLLRGAAVPVGSRSGATVVEGILEADRALAVGAM
eukprot:4420983-Prymnesium_polylepis.1